MTLFLVGIALGFASGIYKDFLADKAREIYIKISERK
jgi:hypothetical protein